MTFFDIVGFILTILGAFSSISWIHQKTSDLIEKRKSRKILSSLSPDFYYSELDIGARISECGCVWNTIRKARIVSLTSDLSCIDIGILPTSMINQEYRIVPATFKVLSRGENEFGFEHWCIKPEKLLKRNEPTNFNFYFDFQKNINRESTQDRLSWSSNRQVNKLCLRVVFTDKYVQSVKFKLFDNSSRVLDERELAIDETTLEFRHTIISPLPNLIYTLTWEWPILNANY